MEKKIQFESDEHTLEGLLETDSVERGVVIAHPHPQHGGNMNNHVVESIANAYKQKKISTLKFNFKGVGQSQGNYENGIGEQKDVINAISYLLKTGIKQIDLAGFSFGSWVIAQAVSNGLSVNSIIMVSPPVLIYDFKQFSSLPGLKLVITGSEDGIARSDIIKKAIPMHKHNARLEIIQGADHFYGGYTRQLEGVIASCL
ncbi:MAG TPA: alpha/beta hydrolase [Desulfobacteraceae bacterium]|nr:alpha/beta hydrolase [Desulfobacteraceae bacterium]